MRARVHVACVHLAAASGDRGPSQAYPYRNGNGAPLMVKRFGNVVFWLALLVLAVLVMNALDPDNKHGAGLAALTACIWAALITAVRYILRGRL